ncbi:protein kinase [Nocardia gamkensis]|uniref:protein kinase domain-containing protein n=1 Tax=Nocardia gamkensis TaxID=352869 RepID=UPI0036E579AF
MAEDDLPPTERDVLVPLADELSAAGFVDAVEIGRGGFGVVYWCLQPELDRAVAVKVLTADSDEENVARFLREQKAMGRLTGHPNIVPVLHAATTATGRPFLVMPYYRNGSLELRVREDRPLSVDAVLEIGFKLASALEMAHKLGVVHRDVKPGNILLSGYGEPALTDFGIARVAGGYQTSSSILTGSPAFLAPELLDGEPPTAAADIYGLGATLFFALTGHAAFERRPGETGIAQLLRAAAEPTPDLRDCGIPTDVATVVATAMDRDKGRRPSAAALEAMLRQMRRSRGGAVGEPASGGESSASAAAARSRRDGGSFSLPKPTIGHRSTDMWLSAMTSFVDRRTEIAQMKNLLSANQLVTLAGIGGVGKTRLAQRVVSEVRQRFADDVCVVELADVSDGSLVTAVVADALGLRDDGQRRLPDVVADFLVGRESLVVLDNCEQVVTALAPMVATWLRTCPGLTILTTSREPLDLSGEVVVRVLPLPVPDPDSKPRRSRANSAAVTLFADRANAVSPGFEITEQNEGAVAGICARLDGLPLAIELAAARMRSMSPAQILQRLDDRYSLLTRSSRDTPARHQTLRWCVDWSYALCDAGEQWMWASLSVFGGGFELDAVEGIFAPDSSMASPVDLLSSLVGKSVLIRDESSGVVRFRMLETIREYGRARLRESGEESVVRGRHRDWYERLVLDAEGDWISARQPSWLARLQREQANVREALEYCLGDRTDRSAEAGLHIVSALFIFWIFRGVYGEARSWIGRVLDHPCRQPASSRIRALHVGCALAAMHGDEEVAKTRLQQGRRVAAQLATPTAAALIAYDEGLLEFFEGRLEAALECFERAAEVFDADSGGHLYVSIQTALGWASESTGDLQRAISHYRQVLAVTEAAGESLFRASALRDLGVAGWQQGHRSGTAELVEEAIRISQGVGSPVNSAVNLEALAWIVGAQGEARRAAVLMGAAQKLWQSAGNPSGIVPMSRHHDETVASARAALGIRQYETAFRQGQAMGMTAAVRYALGKKAMESGKVTSGHLTKRERQVAQLVAEGLTNGQIAAKLVISPRTAEGHVEHILTKLGFNSRAQIARWITEDDNVQAAQP